MTDGAAQTLIIIASRCHLPRLEYAEHHWRGLLLPPCNWIVMDAADREALREIAASLKYGRNRAVVASSFHSISSTACLSDR